MRGSPNNGKREACPPGGMDDYALAKIMGLSQGRVLQLRQRAMKKLREAVLQDLELCEAVSELVGFDVTQEPAQ